MPGLDGKVVLITGAGGMRGVGRATVMKLAGQGADIALSDVRREASDLPPAEVREEWGGIETVSEEVQALGRIALPIYCDLSDPAQIERMVTDTIAKFGRIDILVNNARAIIGKDKVPVTELDKEVWDHFLSINTTAVFLATKFAARHMIDAGNGGRIINIASNACKQASANGAAYSTSKFAVIGWTQAMAQEMAGHRINVNAICPGLVDTERVDFIAGALAPEGESGEEFRADMVRERAFRVPMGRIAQGDDIARMAAFLASAESDYVTGLSISVSGGSEMS